MAKSGMQTKVEFGSVSIGDRAASVPMKWKLNADDPGEHVRMIYDTLPKGRITTIKKKIDLFYSNAGENEPFDA